ncbi:hypothetical protein AM588_10006166 [Phytophthora nicotianae]|uniref:Kazal-like domain-containing protein n=1 Tax=Phytophthora nicotianae TaxID=4792 RepID=A0A0W8D4T0_PHYNI|nr:hypothetical protein AM588_10006166 [Phytophthora nicotianae]
MLMEHRHTQGRPSWTSSVYSTTPSTTATTGTSLIYDVLRPATYSSENSQYQSQQQHSQYSQDQDNTYRYAYNEPPRPAFTPLPPPPRDDQLASRLRYPPPSLPRPMIGGSLSPHYRTLDKTSPMSAVVTPAFVVAKPGGLATPKRATDEERRAKHREAQRRFVKRKKIEMLQLKQLAVELEKRHDLLQVVSEREALARENQILMQQLEAQKEEACESPTSTNQKVATAVVAALACSLSAVEALDRDKMLDVVGTVHGNRHIVVEYDDLEEDREERKCYGHFTRDIDPVCGSNGKKYTNLSMFNYRKCMMKIQEDTEIQLVDMDFCKDAEMEDMEHIDEDDAS